MSEAPHAAVMRMMTAAWLAQTISAVTRLDVPDLVEKHGPLTARALTGAHGVDADPDFLERALRACASAGVFTESEDGRFGPTPLSEPLTLASPASVKRFVELIGGRWWQHFANLPEALRTGRPRPGAVGDADHERKFGEAMASQVDAMRGVVDGYDFSRARTVVDVGGGFGHLAIALVQRHPHLRATVLDLPEVIDLARRRAAGGEVAFVAGDMFAEVPPADTYVLKKVLHDWDDARAIAVLRNCRARMPRDGRVLAVDNVLPPMGDTSAAGTKLLDMLMLVSLPGKERTEAEWRALYDAAGLAVASIRVINPRSGESIIEGIAP